MFGKACEKFPGCDMSVFCLVAIPRKPYPTCCRCFSPFTDMPLTPLGVSLLF